jgi:hypothetical protein
MNPAYQRIIASSNDDQRGLFDATANRFGTTVQNIEKDFWVCWTLDALFHRLKAGSPRFLFKGRHVTIQGLPSDIPLFRGHRRHRVSLRYWQGNKSPAA